MKISIRLLREILRLLLTTDFSINRVAKILSVAPNTVRRYKEAIAGLGLTIEQLNELNDEKLMQKFLLTKGRNSHKVMPDWQVVHERLTKNKHMTLVVLWLEYREINKDAAYSYAQFTHYYRKFTKKLEVAMRIHHYPGEVLFVDYAGTRIPWTDLDNGGAKEMAEIFVSAFGYSNYTFVWASRSQKIEDWIEAHNRALYFYGGVPEAVVPDNLKSAVTRPGKDPVINRTYLELSRHYGFVILPARVRRPQDKSKAEAAVQYITHHITAKLLERQFFSVDEINRAIQELLPEVNARALRDYPGSRLTRFEEADKPALKPLPETPFEFAVYTAAQTVKKEYHVKVEGHWYSVPFRLVSERVEARVTLKTVELFHNHERVAVHVRQPANGAFTTDKHHMPPPHAVEASKNREEFLAWAARVGPAVEALVAYQYQDKQPLSPIAASACGRLKALCRLYEPADFDAACQLAIEIESPSVKSVKSILSTGRHRIGRDDLEGQIALPLHENVRGSGYYSQGEVSPC